MTYSWLAGAVVLVPIAVALIAGFRGARADRARRLGGHRLREGRSGRGGRHRAEPAGGDRRPAGIPRVRAGLLKWRAVAGIHAAADRDPAVRDTDRSGAPRSADMADTAREIGPTGPRLLVAATPAVALIVAVPPFTSGARAGITWCVAGLAFVAGSAVVLALLDHAYARPFGLPARPRPDRNRRRHGRRPGRRRFRPAEPGLSPLPLPPSPERTWPPDAARRPERSW